MASNFYPATGLIGGTTGALDDIDGTDLVAGDGALVINDGQAYLYHLNGSSSASEDNPYVIVPDANPGTKRWELVNIYDLKSGAISALIYANLPGGF